MFPPGVAPSGLVAQMIEEPVPGSWNNHFHAPGFGGEIAWNDIDAIRKINGEIYRQNFNMIKSYDANLTVSGVEAAEPSWAESANDNLKLLWELKQKLQPYVIPIDPSGYPSQGYNRHAHTNDLFGGAIIGAGDHDHRGVGYAGFAFAVYHPGTHIPLRSLRLDD